MTSAPPEDVSPRKVIDTVPNQDLTIDQLIGQLLCPALYGDGSGEPAGSWRDFPPGTFILFGRGAGCGAVRRLIEDHAQQLPRPPLVFSDMECGAGQQVAGLTLLPPAMAIAATKEASLARRAGRLTATEARRAAVNGLFAPVVDVNVEWANPIIATRSFGDSPDRVGTLARAFIEGVRQGGGLSVAKHFPGHGDTSTDSHTELPCIRANRATMIDRHLPPFEACVAAGVDAVMVGHLACPALGTGPAEPASQSRSVISEWLRGTLGFQGLVVTDALDMAGAAHDAGNSAALRSLLAGADLLLMPKDHAVAAAAIADAYAGGIVNRRRLEASARRIDSLRGRIDGIPATSNGQSKDAGGENQAQDPTLAREIAERSVTVFGARNFDPLAPGRSVSLLLLDDSGEPDLARSLVVSLGEAGLRVITPAGETPADEGPRLLAVLTRPRAGHGRTTLPDQEVDRGLRFLQGRGRRLVIGAGGPWTLAPFAPRNGLLAYGTDPESIRALARAVTGDLIPRGTLPVSPPP